MKWIFLFIFILLPSLGFAQWNDCPFKEVNDPFPGKCGRYVDTDGDGICDHSQLPPSERNGQKQNEDHRYILALSTPKEKKHFAWGSRNYHLFEISIPLFFMYIVTKLLSKKAFLSIASHKKIWNWLLLFTFLSSALLGILLIIKISFNVAVSLPFDIVYWHAETGIAMTIISCFHLFEHLKYFKRLLS